jgi:hypothetical protein
MINFINILKEHQYLITQIIKMTDISIHTLIAEPEEIKIRLNLPGFFCLFYLYKAVDEVV